MQRKQVIKNMINLQLYVLSVHEDIIGLSKVSMF